MSGNSTQDFKASWRYRVGLALFVVGHVILLGELALPMLGLGLVGLLMITGEVAFLIGLYVLGAEWWERFRNVVIWQGGKSGAPRLHSRGAY